MKILRVTANNFKLCENNFTIDFIPKANKTEEDKEFELYEVDTDLFVYRTLCFIGKNASGKTTATDLLSVVYDIFTSLKIEDSKSILKHWNQTVNLEVYFYHEQTIYRYVTDIVKDTILLKDDIFLFENQKLFKKVYRKTNIKDIFNNEKYEPIEIKTPLPKSLSILYELFKVLSTRGVYITSDDTINLTYDITFNIYKHLGNTEIIKPILKIFDEHIENLKMLSEDKFIITFNDNFQRKINSLELYEILSSGTSKGFRLFSFLVYSLKTGTDLVIDEIENHFHKSLVEYIISLYKDKSVNKYGATLIFTTHYCELLDLFSRSDNIYITKYEKKIKLENVYIDYNIRTELLKSKKFYNNAFNTNVNYQSLMDFKKELM